MSDRETTGPWVEAQESDDARTDFSVTSGHHRLKTTHARASLSGEEPHAETSVTLAADEDEHTREVPLCLYLKTTDHGMLEGLATADLSIEEAEDLHERLGEAIEAAKEGNRYYER